MKADDSSWLNPIIAFHLSLVVGLSSYAMQFMDQNNVAGMRTPWTLRDPKAWRKANDSLARFMPIVSGLGAAAALSAIWLPLMRSRTAMLSIVGVQVAVILAFAIDWWQPPPGPALPGKQPRPGSDDHSSDEPQQDHRTGH